MADSTNLSLGPSATLKLDRTVFDDATHYRDVAVRLTSGAFRFVTGNSEKAAYKITTPLATIGVRGTTLDILSQRGQTIVNLQEGAASRLHRHLRMHPADQARRYRHHHLKRRQVDDQEDQQPALDVCRDLQRRGGPLQHDAICGCLAASSSTTAAIPPACCAGADDDPFHPQRSGTGRVLRLALLAAYASPAPRAVAVTCADTDARCHTPTCYSEFNSHRRRQVRPRAQPRRRRRHRRRRRRQVRSPARAADRSTTWPTSASTR